MLTYLVVCSVALLASALTFFSGFGLGTLLLPAFALFFPVETAVALTAIVHFLNGIFKAALVARHADRRVVVQFGVPALIASFAGAWLLVRLADAAPLLSYRVGSVTASITPVKIIVGALLIIFAVLELLPWFQKLSFDRRYMPVGGVLSGFFGGLSGMQGALRSAFLIKSGLGKEAFVGTGVVIALMIDVARLSVYSRGIFSEIARAEVMVVVAATAAAFAGAILGNAMLKKVTMEAIRTIVAVMLVLIGLGMVSGIL